MRQAAGSLSRAEARSRFGDAFVDCMRAPEELFFQGILSLDHPVPAIACLYCAGCVLKHYRQVAPPCSWSFLPAGTTAERAVEEQLLDLIESLEARGSAGEEIVRGIPHIVRRCNEARVEFFGGA